MKKNSTPIKRVMDDVLFMDPTPLLKMGDHIVAVRYYEDNLEVIARGQIVTRQNGELLATLEKGTLIKPPSTKDFIITLAKLNGQAADEPFNTEPPDNETTTDPYEPGYIQIGQGQYQGQFDSSASSQANSYKKYNNIYTDGQFLWYFDFLWRLGIEYTFNQSEIPLKSYDRQSRLTTSSENRFALHYRLLPIWKELRPTLKLISLSSSFITANNDEYVLSTTYTGLGLGVHWHYLFNDNLFKTEKSWFDWSFNRLYLDTDLFPSYTAKDGKVSRGEGTGQRLDLKLGAVTLFYFKSIPWVKRYFADIQIGYALANLSFSGTPQSAVDKYYQIPSGSTATETESYIKISLGIRFDDLISRILKGRNE